MKATNPKLLLCLALVLSGMFSHSTHAAIIFPNQAEKYRAIAYQKTISFYHDAHFGFVPKILQIDELKVTNGFRWYWFDERSVLSGKLLLHTDSTSLGWSYMMMCGTNMVGMMELAWNSNHWSFGFPIYSGATLKGQQDPIWVGLEKAERLPQVKNRDYEFRYLTRADLDFPMIWLHGNSDDILIPISDGYGKWKAYKPCSETRMVKLLKPVAEDDLKLDKMYSAIGSALEDYEKANGNQCGPITYLPGMSYLKNVWPNFWICELSAMSTKCGYVHYKASIAFVDKTRSAVKRVEILEKIPELTNVTKP